MDLVEKKDVKADQIDKVDIKDADNLSGKYISKMRKLVSKTFAKRAIWSQHLDFNFNLCISLIIYIKSIFSHWWLKFL